LEILQVIVYIHIDEYGVLGIIILSITGEDIVIVNYMAMSNFK